jgi:hypothetical protein
MKENFVRYIDNHSSFLCAHLRPGANSKVFVQSCLVYCVNFLLVELVIELCLLLASSVAKDFRVSSGQVVELSYFARVNFILRSLHL